MCDMIKEVKIFQIKETTENIAFLFCNFDFCNRYGFKVKRENYQCVYDGEIKEDTTLDDIFYRFNVEIPLNFKGHSLSVSDVIEIHDMETDTSQFWFVDSIGFKEVEDFLS